MVNDTRVLPARMSGKKPSGNKAEIMLERVLNAQRALVMLGLNKLIRTGQAILVGDCMMVVSGRQGSFFELSFPPNCHVEDAFKRWGSMPLPLYIARDASVFDSQRYQTVYAKTPGSVAVLTACLHFDQPLIKRLHERGVAWGAITLHVGAGTFQPVRCRDIRDHQMHHERVEVGEQICQKITQTKHKVAESLQSVRQ